MNVDVLVAGLGGMGSAVAAHAAARGARVLGVERFGPVHGLGSSAGRSRIIRQAYFEDVKYVPLLLRAYELWRTLEAQTQTELLRITGLLLAGPAGGPVVAGSLRAAREHALDVESWSRDDIARHYPQLRVRPDEVGVFERQGGALDPEAAVHAHLERAVACGAQLRFGCALAEWEARTGSVRVTLADGTVVDAGALVLTLGPWFASTLESLGVPIRVQRNVQVWFEPDRDVYAAGAFPAFFLDRPDLPRPLYGFPDFGEGVKAAFHTLGEETEPDGLRRDIDPDGDIAPVAHALEGWMPGASGPVRSAKACMYTLTPDEHFVIDRHPAHANVVLCGGFSGHGFKFASVVGEIGAGLALDGRTAHDIGFLSIGRFAG